MTLLCWIASASAWKESRGKGYETFPAVLGLGTLVTDFVLSKVDGGDRAVVLKRVC